MADENNMSRPARILIISLFFVLFLGSIYFNLERILFADPAFVLFRIINLSALQISEHRYGSFITQLFPLLMSKMHLPLSWIVLIYSASFNFFYLAVAAMLAIKWKEYLLPTLMAFYFTLFVSDSYFWVINEVHQGIAWMFLCFGIAQHFYRKKFKPIISVPVFAVLSFLSIYSHPLVIFPFVFLWILYMLEKKIGSPTSRLNIIFSAIVLLICISRIIVSTKFDHYDSSKLQPLTDFSLTNVIRTLYSPTVTEIFKRCITNYWILVCLFLWGMYMLIRNKKYKLASLVAAFAVVYFLSVFLTLADFITFYTESELMPGTIILAAPFVFYVLPSLQQKTAVMLLAGIFFIRLGYIDIASEKFVARKKWLFSVIGEMREKKITKAIIYNTEIKNKIFSYWAIPEESLIASALIVDQPNLTFVVGSYNSISKRLPQKPSQMISSYQAWGNDSINRRYFSLDTTNGYEVINGPPVLAK